MWDKFNVNDKVEILYNDNRYLSDIQDILEHHVAVGIPINNGEYLPLRIGERVEVIYYDKTNIYSFMTVIVKRENKKIPLVWFAKPNKVKKIQRRKFVRVPVFYDIKCALVEEEVSLEDDLETISDIKFIDSVLVDMSGGGVKLKTELDLKPDDIVLMTVPVKGDNLLVKGKIIRLDEIEGKLKCYGIYFIDLSLSNQEKIIQFIFHIMREQARKGIKEV